jgi:hypothetical protein
MRVHFWYRQRETNDPARLATWCGLDAPRTRVVTVLTQVSCTRCRQSFAARLRQLPDAFITPKVEEPQ